MSEFIVTGKAQRPARMNGTCFYCNQAIGSPHMPDCVLIAKKVRVRAIIEYEVSVPASWGADDVVFHRNESSWCSDNLIPEIQSIEGGCLCECTRFEFIEDTSEAFLSE